MISMAEYYIIIDREEVGPEVKKLIDIQRQCGCATLSGNGAWTIRNASEQDQKAWFATFERAMDIDFPPPCDECGGEKSECCCDHEDKGDPPIAKDQGADK
jgi:hypothetical protein